MGHYRKGSLRPSRRRSEKMLLKNVDVHLKRCCICAVSAVAAVGLCVWQAVLLCRYFEPDSELYAVGAPSRVPLYAGITAFSALLLLSVLLLLPKNEGAGCAELCAVQGEPRAARYVRMICGVLLGAGAVVRAVGLLMGRLSYSLSALLASVSVILQLMFAVYFLPELLACISGRTAADVERGRAVCGMAGIVWYALEALESYIDRSVPVSSEYRRLTVLCLLVLMLFFASEIRMRISAPRPRRYLFMCCFSAVLCGSVYIGGLIEGIVHGVGFCRASVSAVTGTVAAVYILTRLISFTVTPGDGDGRAC